MENLIYAYNNGAWHGAASVAVIAIGMASYPFIVELFTRWLRGKPKKRPERESEPVRPEPARSAPARKGGRHG